MTVRLGLGMGWGCRFELKNVGKTTHYVSQSLVVPRPWLVMAFAAAHRTMGAESIHVPRKPEKSAPVPTSTYVGDPLHPGGTGTQRHDTVPRGYLTRRQERHERPARYRPAEHPTSRAGDHSHSARPKGCSAAHRASQPFSDIAEPLYVLPDDGASGMRAL